jgi:hypothetical protein
MGGKGVVKRGGQVKDSKISKTFLLSSFSHLNCFKMKFDSQPSSFTLGLLPLPWGFLLGTGEKSPPKDPKGLLLPQLGSYSPCFANNGPEGEEFFLPPLLGGDKKRRGFCLLLLPPNLYVILASLALVFTLFTPSP